MPAGERLRLSSIEVKEQTQRYIRSTSQRRASLAHSGSRICTRSIVGFQALGGDEMLSSVPDCGPAVTTFRAPEDPVNPGGDNPVAML
jgi:hypothetical protein